MVPYALKNLENPMPLSKLLTAMLLCSLWPLAAEAAKIYGDDSRDGYLEIVADTVYWYHVGGLVTKDSYHATDGFRMRYCAQDGRCNDILFTVKSRRLDGTNVSKISSKLPKSYMESLSMDWKPFWQSEESVFMPVYQASKQGKDINVGDFSKWRRKLIPSVQDKLQTHFSDEYVKLYLDEVPTQEQRRRTPEVGEQQVAPQGLESQAAR